MNSKNVFALFVAFSFSLTLFAKTVDCSDPKVWTKGVHGKSIKECNDSVQKFSNSCEKDVLESTGGQVSLKVAEINCLHDVMNAELDKRLLPLKKSNPAQFKNEMKLQKAFNMAQTKSCNAFNACSGTMYKVTRAECEIFVLQYRIKQVLQINTNSLAVPELKPIPEIDAKLKPIAELTEYADLTCRMPKEVFKDAKVPANCSAVIANEFTSALNGDCGEDE